MKPDYNIPPGVDIWAVRNDEKTGKPAAVHLRWGLVPSWAKDPKVGYRMINARSETTGEKPAFRTAFKQRRCIIPADGFYEWKRDNKTRIPYYVQLKEHEPFAMAGLWERWHGPAGEELQSCTILTTAANSLVENLHDRMPVILPQEAIETWLAKDTPLEDIKALTVPYPAKAMEAYPVSSLVNSPRNNSPACLQRCEPLQQKELF